jgi:hypothetical protein
MSLRLTPFLAATGLLFALLPHVVWAQEEAAGGPVQAEPSPEEIANLRRSVQILHAFSGALRSEDVQELVKAQLLTCLYERKLSEIATETGLVFANNPILDEQNPTDFYRAAAGVCGILFRRAAPGSEGRPANLPTLEVPPDGESGR